MLFQEESYCAKRSREPEVTSSFMERTAKRVRIVDDAVLNGSIMGSDAPLASITESVGTNLYSIGLCANFPFDGIGESVVEESDALAPFLVEVVCADKNRQKLIYLETSLYRKWSLCRVNEDESTRSVNNSLHCCNSSLGAQEPVNQEYDSFLPAGGISIQRHSIPYVREEKSITRRLEKKWLCKETVTTKITPCAVSSSVQGWDHSSPIYCIPSDHSNISLYRTGCSPDVLRTAGSYYFEVETEREYPLCHINNLNSQTREKYRSVLEPCHSHEYLSFGVMSQGTNSAARIRSGTQNRGINLLDGEESADFSHVCRGCSRISGLFSGRKQFLSSTVSTLYSEELVDQVCCRADDSTPASFHSCNWKSSSTVCAVVETIMKACAEESYLEQRRTLFPGSSTSTCTLLYRGKNLSSKAGQELLMGDILEWSHQRNLSCQDSMVEIAHRAAFSSSSHHFKDSYCIAGGVLRICAFQKF